MPGPLKTLTESLKHEGCALDNLLNRGKRDSRVNLRDPAYAKIEPLLGWISLMHASTDLGLGSVLLDVAHFYDWPRVRRRVAEDGWPVAWQSELAPEEFHGIADLVILCKYCHTLFDMKLLPEGIVQAAREQMWAMPSAKPALIHFIKTSLSNHRHQPVPFNVSQAALWLNEHHGICEPFVVYAQPRKRRMSYIVYPETGMVTTRFGGDAPRAEIML